MPSISDHTSIIIQNHPCPEYGRNVISYLVYVKCKLACLAMVRLHSMCVKCQIMDKASIIPEILSYVFQIIHDRVYYVLPDQFLCQILIPKPEWTIKSIYQFNNIIQYYTQLYLWCLLWKQSGSMTPSSRRRWCRFTPFRFYPLLVRRLRRRPSIITTLDQRLVFAGLYISPMLYWCCGDPRTTTPSKFEIKKQFLSR